MDLEELYTINGILRFGIAFCLSYYSNHIILRDLLENDNSDVYIQPVIIECLFYKSIAALLIPRMWISFLLVVLRTWILFAIESYIDERHASAYAHSPMPSLGPTPSGHWETIAITKSANHGYVTTSSILDVFFYPVTICDSHAWNNPFWPDHISAVYNVEIRRRSSIWRTIILWKHSTLHGGQKKVHEFDYYYGWISGRDGMFNRRFPYTGPRYFDLIVRPGGVCCWQSKGVILISLKGFVRDVLCVYDTVHEKVRTYEIAGHQDSIAVYCLNRLFNPTDGSLDGWRIRWLYIERERIDGNQYKLCLMNKKFDLREKAICVGEECVLIGKYEDRFLHLSPVRTSDDRLGFWVVNLGGPSPVITFDVSSNSYVYYRSYYHYVSAHLSTQRRYYYTDDVPPFGTSVLGLRLIYFHRNEKIICYKQDTYCRKSLVPPTLKYLAAKQLLRSNPNLHGMSTAEQFRRLTGIEGMNDHFEL